MARFLNASRDMEQLNVRSTLVATVVLLAGTAVACSSGNVGNIIPESCTVQCQNTENNCVQKCSDENCKTKCMTDFNNCTLTCTRAQSDAGGATD